MFGAVGHAFAGAFEIRQEVLLPFQDVLLLLTPLMRYVANAVFFTTFNV